MAYATNEERKTLRDGSTACDFTVQIVTRDGREIEMAADDVDHALNIQGAWLKNHGAKESEIFRILADGSLNPTIGRVFA